jgi:hypothetical protein
LRVSHRPLAIVSGLTIGDYLLWNWSLNGHHDVLALTSGLTLPPLTIAFLWLLALTLARVLASTTRHSRTRAASRARSRPRRARHRAVDGSPAVGALAQSPAPPYPAPASTASSRKLAA